MKSGFGGPSPTQLVEQRLPFLLKEERQEAARFLHTILRTTVAAENHSLGFILGFESAIKSLENGE